jgi:thioester reductase-like protein
MKVLVTGANGFVGQAMLLRLNGMRQAVKGTCVGNVFCFITDLGHQRGFGRRKMGRNFGKHNKRPGLRWGRCLIILTTSPIL